MSEFITINDAKVRRSRRIAGKPPVVFVVSQQKNKKKSYSLLYTIFKNSIFFILLNELEIVLLLRAILLSMIIFAHIWFPIYMYDMIYSILDNRFMEEYTIEKIIETNNNSESIIKAIISKNFTNNSI